MDFRTTLSQFNVLLDKHVACLPHDAKPSNLFVNQEGSRIFSSPLFGVESVENESILRLYFSRLSDTLKKYSYHTNFLFKASKKPDGPLCETLCKVQRILIWGGIKPKYGAPMLKLLQSPVLKLWNLISRQEDQWKEMGSILSWDQFLFLCKQLDKERNFCCAAYIALSFTNPNLQTLNKFKLFLEEYSVIKCAPELIHGLAYRTSAIIQTPHEETALKEILANLPPIEKTFFPENCTFTADFKSEILYCCSETVDPLIKKVFSPIFSPTQSLDGTKNSSFSFSKIGNWPQLNRKAFEQLVNRDYPSEALKFLDLPEHLRKDGLRLIRKAQKAGFLSKGDSLSDFTRIDLMALHFLYHSNETPPKERYIVSNDAPFSLGNKDPLQEMGKAIRAYIEYDFPYLYFHFERAIENGEICYWEKKENGLPQLKKIEVVDPLTFLMADLRIAVQWVETLFFMEKVQLCIKSGD